MKYTGAQLIIKLVEEQGVELIAGIPGGANLPIYDALYHSTIRHILVRHEQSAGFIAQGIARTTGKAAVCLATSGPGITNLLTAIADAKLDSCPIIAITGQVPTALIGTDAFQEVDTYGLSLPITKHNFLAKSPHDLLHIIPEAFRIATSGRPGPVLIDIPKDVQTATLDIDQRQEMKPPQTVPSFDPEKLQQVADRINHSQRPLIYLGGGIIHAQAASLVRTLSKTGEIPSVSTLLGLGAIDTNDPLFLGMLGMHGTPVSHQALQRCDILLALGVRFDDRATGKLNSFCPQARVIHIDIDQAELDKLHKTHLSICGDLHSVLSQLLPLIQPNRHRDWLAELTAFHTTLQSGSATIDRKHPRYLLELISREIPPDSIICTDVGQHQMWVAQHYPFHFPRTLLTSGGLGTMGFGLPTAIGAGLANPDKLIACFSGDGSILMNLQELATLAELNLNLKIILFNNGHLGLVRQQQALF